MGGGVTWPFINIRFRQLWPCWKGYNWLFECILTCCATRSANMFCPPAPWAGQSQGYWGGGLQGLALGGFLTIVSARIIRKLRDIIFPISITAILLAWAAFKSWKFSDNGQPQFIKGLGSDCISRAHSAIWGELGTALQAYTLNPGPSFPQILLLKKSTLKN